MSNENSDVKYTEDGPSKENSSVNLTTSDALSLFSSSLDSVLNKHKHQILEEFDNKLLAHERLVSSSKSDFTFKFEGNKQQFDFYSARQLDISKAIVFLKESKCSQVLSILEECNNSLLARNKIVKIADKHGWDTVSEYQDNPIADDSEDSAKLSRQRPEPSGNASLSLLTSVPDLSLDRLILREISFRGARVRRSTNSFFVAINKQLDTWETSISSPQLDINKSTEPSSFPFHPITCLSLPVKGHREDLAPSAFTVMDQGIGPTTAPGKSKLCLQQTPQLQHLNSEERSDILVQVTVLNSMRDIILLKMGEGYELPEPLGAVPIRCLGPSARRMLAIFLDPPACIITEDNLVPDASGLAELAGFDHVMIRFFENKPNKTEAILDNWRSCDNGTLGNLVKYLIQLERFDCLSEIWDKIVADAQKWLRRRDSHTSVSDAHTSSYSPPGPTSTNIASRDVLLTTDDVDNGIAQTYNACICCSDNDLDLARGIMDNLSSKAKIFIPQDHLLSGGYEFEATAEIIEERCGGRIIVILSTYYTTSPACTFATQFAKTLDPDSKRRQIIPVLKDEDAEFPRVLRGISMIKYHRCRDMQEFYKHLTQSLRLPTTQSKDVLLKNRQSTVESNSLSLGTMPLHSSSIACRDNSNKESRTNDLNTEKDSSCIVSSSPVRQHLNISCSVNEDNVNPENTKVMSRSISEGSGNMTLEQNLSKSSKTPKSVTKVLKTFKDAFRKLDKKDVSKVVNLKHDDEVWKNSSEKSTIKNKHTSELENSTKHKKSTTLPLESCKPKETCSRVPIRPNSSPLKSSQSTEYLLKDNSCSSRRRDITSNGVCSDNRKLKNHHTARQFSLPTQSSLNYAGITGKQNYTISSRPPDGKDFEHCMAGEPVFELTL